MVTADKGRQKAILNRHEKKLIKFRKNQNITPQVMNPVLRNVSYIIFHHMTCQMQKLQLYLMVWTLIFPQILVVTHLQQNSNSFFRT